MPDKVVNQPKVISRFRGKYKFLSNFAESQIEIDGIVYPTVEHAYQERKTTDHERRKIIRNADDPHEAAELGRADETEIREGWFDNDLKGYVMKNLVWEKFKQNSDLAKKLLETDDAYLIEGNHWCDNYFGVCTCKKCHHEEEGKNWLGRILMHVRERLKFIMKMDKMEIESLDKEDAIKEYNLEMEVWRPWFNKDKERIEIRGSVDTEDIDDGTAQIISDVIEESKIDFNFEVIENQEVELEPIDEGD